MKRCPSCSRTFTDVSLNFCLEDGTPLVNDTGLDHGAAYSRENNPPATEIFPPRATDQPPRTPVRYETPGSARTAQRAPANQWSPLPTMPPPKKSNAVWWILGGIVVAGIVVVGVAVMILALASMGSNSNGNINANVRNANSRVANRNANVNANNSNNSNFTADLPSLTTDDFSEETWGQGTFSYGDISYEDGEYRMRAKQNSYLVMYAPTNDYSTENARTRVTVQDVEGAVSSGYGLIVHGQKTAASQLEDYALLIFTGAQPQYEIVKHKAGVQTTVVPWTKSNAVLPGTSANQLEIRARGSELSFYINGQYVNRITDNEIKKGVAGFYTSGTSEVAFDDLEIRR